jgi:hypothetical protein
MEVVKAGLAFHVRPFSGPCSELVQENADLLVDLSGLEILSNPV